MYVLLNFLFDKAYRWPKNKPPSFLINNLPVFYIVCIHSLHILIL